MAGGKDKLTYTEIDAYMRVTYDILSPWEIDVIFKLEVARNGC